MANKELRIAKNTYEAKNYNNERIRMLQSSIESDPWFRSLGDDLQKILLEAFIPETSTQDPSSDKTPSVTKLGVAAFDYGGMAKVLSDSASVIASMESLTPYKVERAPVRFAKNETIQPGYQALKEAGFLEAVLHSKDASDLFTYNDYSAALPFDQQDGYQIHQTRAQLKDAIENIRDKGKFVGFDLETTGGKVLGSRILPQHITEFSFAVKEVGEDKPSQTFQSIIGSTAEEDAEYKEIINKLKTGTMTKIGGRFAVEDLSFEERVTLKRLAKMGSRATEISEDQGNGIFNFTRFASSEDVALMDIQDIERGAERLREIGKKQEAANKVSFEYGGKTYGNIYGWEERFLQGIAAIYQEQLTAVGHNTRTFDLPVLNRFINSDRLSEGAKKALKAITDGGYLNFKHHLDTLAVMRQHLPKNFYNDSDLTQMEKLGLTENQQEAIIRRLTAKTTEYDNGVFRDWSNTIYERGEAGAAHMAMTDVLLNLKLTEDLILGGDKTVGEDKEIGKTISKNIQEYIDENKRDKKLADFIEGDSGQIFFSKGYFDPRRYNLMFLQEDVLSGQLRTMDSMAMTEEGEEVSQQLFGQTGMQKGVSYKINKVSKITTGSKYHDIMKNMYPGMDVGELAILELETFLPGKDKKQFPVKAQGRMFYIGTKEELSHAMMDNTFFVGIANEHGGIKEDSIPEDTQAKLRVWHRQEIEPTISREDWIKKQLKELEIKDTPENREKLSKHFDDAVKVSENNISGRHVKAPISEVHSDDFSPEVVLEGGAKRASQEAGARLTRQHNFLKDEQLLKFYDYLEAETEKRSKEKSKALGNIDPASVAKNAREEILEKFWKKSLSASRKIANGQQVTAEELENTYNSFFGYTDRSTGVKGKMFSDTLSAQMARYEWMAANRDVIGYALQKADELAGTGANKETKNYYYQQIMKALEDKAAANYEKNSYVMGWRDQGLYEYEFKDRFDIDLSGFQGISQGTIATVHLDSQSHNIINPILRVAERDIPGIKDYEPAEQSALLKHLQKFLTSRQGGYRLGDTINEKFRIKDKDSYAVAARKFQNFLKDLRENDKHAGHLIDTKRHTLETAEHNFFYGNDEKAKKEIETDIEEIGQSIAKLKDVFPVKYNKFEQEKLIKDMASQYANEAIDAVLMLNDEDKNNKLRTQILEDFKKQGIKIDENKGVLENLQAAGYYTEEEINALKQIRTLHRKGLHRYVSDVFEMVGNLGGSIGWDEKNKLIFAQLEGKTVNLELPREVLIGKQFQWRIGGNLVSMPTGYYDLASDFERGRNIQAVSLIEKAVANQEGLMRWHIDEALEGRGGKLYHLGRVMGDINKVLRESPGVGHVLQASRADQFRVDYEDLFKNLKEFLTVEQVNKWRTDESYKGTIKALVAGNQEYSTEHPEYHHLLALQANIGNIFQAANTKFNVSANFQKFVIDQLTINIKALKQHRAAQVSPVGDWYTLFNGTKRDPGSIEDAAQINVTGIKEKQALIAGLSEGSAQWQEFEGLRGISIGKTLTNETVYRAATDSDNLNYEVNTHIRGVAIHSDPRSLNMLITSNMEDALKVTGASIQSASLLKSMMPIEGTAFMHAHVFDNIFSERLTLQRIDLRKIVDHNAQEVFDLEYKEVTNHTVKIDEDGKVHFKYAKGKFVQEDEIFAHIPGLGARPHGVGAKYEGLLKFGFFDKVSGHLISEENLAQIIEEDKDIKAIRTLDARERADRIMAILKDKFETSYYVQTEKANPFEKFNEYGEKQMTRALISGTGSIDQRIHQVMDALGFYGGQYEISKYDAKEGTKRKIGYLGSVGILEKKMIDSIKEEGFEDSDFVTAAIARMQRLGKGNGKDISSDLIKDIIAQAGFKDFKGHADLKAFRQAILKERDEPTRLVSQILKQYAESKKGSGILSEDTPIWHVIVNHQDNVLSHKDITAVRASIDDAVIRTKNKYLADVEWQKGLRDDKPKWSQYLTSAGDNEHVALETAATQQALEDTKEKIEKYLLDGDKHVAKDWQDIIDANGGQSPLEVENGSLIFKGNKSPVALNLAGLEEFQKATGLRDKQGHIIGSVQQRDYYEVSPDGDYVTPVSLQNVAQIKARGGKIIEGALEVAQTTLSQNSKDWDWEKTAKDAVRFNQRALTIAGAIRSGKQQLAQVKQFLDERATKYATTANFAGVAGSDLYTKFLSPLEGKDGTIINQAAIDQIRRNMFNRQGGGEEISGFLARDDKGKLTWGINEAEVERFVRDFNVGGGDIRQGKEIITTMLGKFKDNMGITTVNRMGLENAYKGFMATVANSLNTGKITVAEAKNLGFKEINIDDLVAGKMGTGTFDESLYGQNWIVNLESEGFGSTIWENAPNNASGKYLAVAANPIPTDPSEYRDEIASQPQEQLKSLKDKIDNFRKTASSTGFTQSERKNRDAKLQDIFQQFQVVKNAQYNIWAGKKGLIDEATRAWMYDATRATARGMNLFGTESIGVQNIKDGDKIAPGSGLEGLVKYAESVGKSVDISQLTFNGQSLVEEARKGEHALQINYAILSKDRMKDIYNKQFGAMAASFTNENKGAKYDDFFKKLQTITETIAQTEGVEGISAREPLQYYGAITQRRIYFSNLAQGNEAIGDFVGAQARKEDYDSDKVTNALHREQVELKIGDNQSIKISADSAMLAALQQMKEAGESISYAFLDEGGEERMRNYTVSQLFLGAGEMQRYRILSGLQGGPTATIDSYSADHLAEAVAKYDQTGLLSKKSLALKAQWTVGERREAQSQFEDILRNVYKNMVYEGIANRDLYGDNFVAAYGEVQRMKIFDNLQATAEAAGVELGQGQNAVLDLAYDALKFSFHDATLAQDLFARTGFAPTGMVNRYLQTTYNVFNSAIKSPEAVEMLERSGKDVGVLAEQISLINLAMQEGFMSPKNTGGSIEELNTKLMNRIKRTFTDTFSLSDNSTQQERNELKGRLTELLKDVILPRQDKEMARNPALPTLSELIKTRGNDYGVDYNALVKKAGVELGIDDPMKALEGYTERAIEAYADFFVEHVAWRGNKNNVFDFATSNGNGNNTNTPVTILRGSADIRHELVDTVFNETAKQMGTHDLVNFGENIGVRDTVSRSSEIAAQAASISEERRHILEITPEPKIKEVSVSMSGAKKLAKNKGILGATIGVAGGLLISGFMNPPVTTPQQNRDSGYPPIPDGAPYAFGNMPIPNSSLPEPSTGLAAGGAAAYAAQYPSVMPQLADSNLNVMRGMPRNSYTINISGTSLHGQQSAINAINSAMTGRLPQNSSINIAVNSNYQDMLSQAQVNRMIQTAMGI